MKIIENTHDRLVLRDRPWVLAAATWAMGLLALYSAITGVDMDSWAERILVLCLGIGASAIAWWFFGFLTLTLDRPSGRLAQEIHRIGLTRRREMPLDRVRRARLQAEQSEGGGRLERLAVETADGPVALELGFSGFGRNRFATAINDWLANDGGAVAD